MSTGRRYGALVPSLLVAAFLIGCGAGGSTAPSAGVAGAAGIAANNGGGTTPTSSADALVDSVGVNVHMSEYGTLYGDDFARTAALLEGLGVRHVRDGIPPAQARLCNEYQQLAQSGIRLDFIAPSTADTGALASAIACPGVALESVEGPNEYDLAGDPNWAADLRADQQALSAAVAGKVAVLAPALSSESSFAVLGSVAGIAGFGNMHDYLAGHAPGTPGWGATDTYGTYGSIAWNMAIAAQSSGTLPIQATETGYSDQSDPYAVPPSAKMDYTLRVVLEHWLHGVSRTYFYELIDEGSVPFSHYGLVDSNGNPKPVYVALKNLLAKLRDPGGSFQLQPIALNVTAPGNVHNLLLEKRNATYELIVWNELPEFDPATNLPIAVAPQWITLGFGKVPTTVKSFSFDASGAAVSTTILSSTTITLTVTSTPTILDINP